uniref:neural cell adhesion molecule 1-like n=1 Tax=Myxine glutinosa TaxID=7769 RepID=UPI00358F04D5
TLILCLDLLTLAGEPNAPKVKVRRGATGNSLEVRWVPQDDGGQPILNYIVKHRLAGTHGEWKEQRVSAKARHVTLKDLQWSRHYDVKVFAVNRFGESHPGHLSHGTATRPTTAPAGERGLSIASLSTGAIIGIVVVIFLIILVAIDITCFVLKKCGLLMCLTDTLCRKAGPGVKAGDAEQGKASFSKEDSKEPIVEAKPEEEATANHEDPGQSSEPTETTPLTQPEKNDSKAAGEPSPVATSNSGSAVNSTPTSTTTNTTSTIAPETATSTAPTKLEEIEVKTVPSEARVQQPAESKA